MVMTMTRLPLAVIASSLALALLLVAAPQAWAQSLGVNTIANFESPAGGWSYNPPVTVLQPWTWTSGLGGIASVGSPWDAPPPVTPASPNQYAFIQTTATRTSSMWTTLNGLTSGSSYIVSFWYGARSDGFTRNTTNDQLTVFYNGVQAYQSPANISDLGGFIFATSTFTATANSGTLNFTVASLNDLDRALLVDSVVVRPSNYVPIPAQVAVSGSTLNSVIGDFESPSVNGATYGTGVTIQNYWYNPPVATNQPWIFADSLGGVALAGSPWDPPVPARPPSGSQYAFVQTSPNMRSSYRSSNMSTTVTNLTPGSSYMISFYWAARLGKATGEIESGNDTQSQLTVYVNNVAVYISAQNLTDVGGWFFVTSNPFVASASSAPLVFAVRSLTDDDHALLFDSVTVLAGGGVLTLGVSTGSNFESPFGSWQYNPPMTVLQPWTWTTQQGGIAYVSSPWDPPAPTTPPSPGQYAFLQSSPGGAASKRAASMWTTLTGLTPGTAYTITFSYAARSDGFTMNTTNDQLTVYYNGAQVWQSAPNIVDMAGWAPVIATFTASASSGQLNFTVVSTNDLDRAILVDSVIVQPSSYTPPLGQVAVSGSTFLVGSFETPSLNGSTYGAGISIQTWWYNPPVSSTQPWTWLNNLGGVAITRSPWDPPPPIAPPAGSQYGFLQTSPNMGSGSQLSTMSTTLVGLTVNNNYVVTFYWAARAASTQGEIEPGYTTQSQLTVIANGVTVYQSVQNLTDLGGWQPILTSAFQATSQSATLAFSVRSLTDDDHTILIDTVSVGNAGSLSLPSSSSAMAVSSSAINIGSGSLAVGNLGTFESPYVPSYFQYNPPVTSLQPWSWATLQGGIAAAGSPWDPPPPVTPPSPNQYAFIQTDPGAMPGMQDAYMATTLTGLSVGTLHTLTFFYGARDYDHRGNATNDQLTVLYNNVQVWQSAPNIVDPAGWASVTATFTPTVASAPLVFSVHSTTTLDFAILIDSVLVQSSAYTPPPGSVALSAPTSESIIGDFESPSLNASVYGTSIQTYWYNPPVMTSQPWTFTNILGGIALTGSAWDPPAPAKPPTGSQYAFIQTSPNMLNGFKTSTMFTTVTGMQSGADYLVSFYWAARLGKASGEIEPGNQTQSQLTVTANGATIYQSAQNLTDTGGWFLVSTSSFATSANSVSLQFAVRSLTDDDHAILIDAVKIKATGSSIPDGSSSSSSSLGGGAIAGIVIGSVVGALLLCALFLLCFTRRSSKKSGGDDATGKWQDHHDVEESHTGEHTEGSTSTDVEMA